MIYYRYKKHVRMILLLLVCLSPGTDPATSISTWVESGSPIRFLSRCLPLTFHPDQTSPPAPLLVGHQEENRVGARHIHLSSRHSPRLPPGPLPSPTYGAAPRRRRVAWVAVGNSVLATVVLLRARRCHTPLFLFYPRAAQLSRRLLLCL
jgi:hypothetical protein